MNKKFGIFAGSFSMLVSISMLIWLWPMMSVDPNQLVELPPPIERSEASKQDDDEWWR